MKVEVIGVGEMPENVSGLAKKTPRYRKDNYLAHGHLNNTWQS